MGFWDLVGCWVEEDVMRKFGRFWRISSCLGMMSGWFGRMLGLFWSISVWLGSMEDIGIGHQEASAACVPLEASEARIWPA